MGLVIDTGPYGGLRPFLRSNADGVQRHRGFVAPVETGLSRQHSFCSRDNVVVRVEVKPELLRWACKRDGRSLDELHAPNLKVLDWAAGVSRPTLRQLETFAHKVHAPIGFFFLPEPPREALPLPDFRTVSNKAVGRPSTGLRDTIYRCQQMQDWYREHQRRERSDPLSFVGAARVGDDVVATAAAIRAALDLEGGVGQDCRSWEDALRRFIQHTEEAGVLVMVNGVVANNTHRGLDRDEFRGFAIADDVAPLVFVNGRDYPASQLFTLAHELAHLWCAETGISDSEAATVPENEVEAWCNRVAAELLVPLDDLRQRLDRSAETGRELDRLRRHYKTSSLVLLRRFHDAGAIDRQSMWAMYRDEEARFAEARSAGGGGNFYATENRRVGTRFAKAVISSTLAGSTLFRDAYQMLGFHKDATFHHMAAELGVT